MTHASLLALLALACAPCACAAPPYEARASYAPADAARALEHEGARAWVVRGGERTELPPGARVEPGGEGKLGEARVTFPPGAAGVHVRRLEDGDAIVVDEQDRIVAIRGKNGVETRFVPGTATARPGSDEVLVMQTSEVLLAPGDRIEVLTRYADGDVVPGKGRVEERHKTGTLVLGGLVELLGYGPALYVGATSTLKADRALLAPLVGPWIDLATRPRCRSTPNPIGVDTCTGETAAKVGLVAVGAAEALGALLVVLGLPAETVVVRDDGTRVTLGARGLRATF